MDKIKLCDYGCGQEATHQFKNGKWCCSHHRKICPEEIRKNKGQKRVRKSKRDKPELCDYGCGNSSKYQFGNKKWCCSKSQNSCPNIKFKLLKKRREKPKLCDYGCGRPAKFYIKYKDKWCCENNTKRCIEVKNQNTPIKINTKSNCDYGCGNIAQFKFKNGKNCCSDDFKKCPGFYIRTKEFSIITSIRMKILHKDPSSTFNTEEYKKKLIGPRGSYLEQMKDTEIVRIRIENLRNKALIRMSIKENRDKISGLNNYKGGKTNIEYFGKEKAEEIRINFSGENHPHWIIDRNTVHELYTIKFRDKNLRLNIVQEQKNVCLVCERELKDKGNHLHHIDYNKKNDSRENLMMVHNSCNIKVNFKRDYWENKLRLLNERIINCV